MDEKDHKERPTETETIPRNALRRPRPFWKSILFTIIIVTAFFGLLELVLALIGVHSVLVAEDPFVGFAEKIPLFVEERQPDGSVLLKTARNKWDWFNRDQAFPKEKGRNSYRIFCMGGSTTYGHPYYDRVSFCGWLRAFLRAADPSRDWEVINAGGISYASYRVAHLMNELTQYQPDLFIVYSGQNEFLEQRSYGSLKEQPPWALRASAMLSRTRTWAAMERALEAVRPDSIKKAKERYQLSGEVNEILTHTLGPTTYRRDDPLKERIIAHFRLNLIRMVQIARESGAEVLFVQPAINLKDMSPFKSEHKEGFGEEGLRRWEERYRRGGELQKGGRFDEALAAYREALQIDDRYADLHYRIGQVLFEMKKYDEAEKAFWRAVEEDIVPLRILRSMQQVVEEVAADEGAPLVDFPRLLREAYSRQYDHAVFGKEYFVDHVHTNIEGYRLLGLALLDQMARQKIVTPDPSWGAETIQTVEKEVMSGLNRFADGLALKNIGKLFDWAGKFEEANAVFLRALEALGPDAEIYRRLTTSAMGRGAFDEAIFYLSQAAVLEPDRPDIHHRLARLLAQQGRIEEAIEHYRMELQHFPNNYIVHTDLAVMLARKGENEAARRHFDAALKLSPDFEFAHLNLAILLAKERRYDEALAHNREVLRVNPAQHLAHIYSGVILKNQGKTEAAIHHFSEAVRLKPDDPVAKKNLEEALAERKK
ncbi:MAG: tetratricopeptide repeat protein [Candidatus Manganitrophus sp.]|nr:tetratricopeptide repeat protein [Candidatus Manganitrophus sp.]WDT73141.1 MAG: tetratricopeptide repeat protein [Candidatus Manganitrophus sp.]WDT79319.1 MAG: tetratricopeptide repeat protein [Candidatus Manganitrophus sp.]